MGNNLNCMSNRKAAIANPSAHCNPTSHSPNCHNDHPTKSDHIQANRRSNDPDLLPENARKIDVSDCNSKVPVVTHSTLTEHSNNNVKLEPLTFEAAFQLSQQTNTQDVAPSVSKKNMSSNCYVNIKPFVYPLPPVPSATEPESISPTSVSDCYVEPIPQEEASPPVIRRALPILPDDDDEYMDTELPKLPPRPSNLVLSVYVNKSNHSMESDEVIHTLSPVETPLPRKVGFTPDDGGSMATADAENAPEDALSNAVVKKRPRKPPRNYTYKASTLPKRISHTTEEVMELWDEVRRAISLEKLNETTSLHISEENDEDDVDEIYQNLYAARMRSWQIICLAQDVLVEKLKPERVWECFLADSLISKQDYDSYGIADSSRKESSMKIIDCILEHGDGWFDRFRELLRNHEDQCQISHLLEALNDVFIAGAKANRWSFSLTTRHCTVQQMRLRNINEQPDVIGDTSDGQSPVLILEMYDENLGNSSCQALADILRKYNVISQLNIGKNRINSKGIAKLVSGVEGNKCLEKLNLRLNPIENIGLEMLVRALERNSSIKEVILCHTQLKEGSGILLKSLLMINSKLESLDLSYNDISDTDCRHVCEALSHNQSIRTLNMRGNQLSPESGSLFGTALSVSGSYLRTLDISHNQITDDGITSLSAAIKTSGNLKELHVESCNISKIGCIALADSLSSNHSMAALYLSNNPIGDDGCEAIADMLTINSTLQTLYVNLCAINRRSLHRLLVVISHDNFTLQTLGACYNNIYLQDDSIIQEGFEAVDIRNALNRALEFNSCRKILLWGKVNH